MSTTAFPGYPATSPFPLSRLAIAAAAESASLADLDLPILTSLHPGRAIEILRHAVEYLSDSRMFLIDQPANRADTEAAGIMMRLCREAFTEYCEVTSIKRRFVHWRIGQVSGIPH